MGKDKKAKLSPEERSAKARASVEVHWAPYRAARIAAGLAPTKDSARGKEQYLSDPDEEALYLYEAERLGLVFQTDTRIDMRKRAKRLSDTAVELSLKGTPARAGKDADLELLALYWVREVRRWRMVAERDRRRAITHDEYAGTAERALASVVAMQARRAR